jgi:hypothetical protein
MPLCLEMVVLRRSQRSYSLQFDLGLTFDIYRVAKPDHAIVENVTRRLLHSESRSRYI